MRVLCLFGLALLMLGAHKAFSFPDMIRHNYTNCVSCHISPTGGKILSPYGRMMAGEVLSTWSGETESHFMHGALPEESLDSWLIGGGDIRFLQVHRESPTRKQGAGFLMQAALDVASRFKSWTGVISIGEPQRDTRTIEPVISTLYVMNNITEPLSLRVGKFQPVFGIHTPYHTLPTRQSLGFGPGQEKLGLEANYSGLDWDAGLSLTQTADKEIDDSNKEEQLTLRINRHFWDSNKVGASALIAESEAASREALSLHGLFGISKKWAYLSEFAFQQVRPEGSASSLGLYHFSQLIYEPVQGVNFYLLEDYAKADLTEDLTLSNSLGVGARFFPRPHFEFDLLYSKTRAAALGDRYDDFAWILAHYYF